MPYSLLLALAVAVVLSGCAPPPPPTVFVATPLALPPPSDRPWMQSGLFVSAPLSKSEASGVIGIPISGGTRLSGPLGLQATVAAGSDGLTGTETFVLTQVHGELALSLTHSDETYTGSVVVGVGRGRVYERLKRRETRARQDRAFIQVSAGTQKDGFRLRYDLPVLQYGVVGRIERLTLPDEMREESTALVFRPGLYVGGRQDQTSWSLQAGLSSDPLDGLPQFSLKTGYVALLIQHSF